MPHRRAGVILIASVVIAIIGYAATGLAISAIRVANAERTLNAVVSHQITLNSTFTDINTQVSALSSGTAFNPQQAIVLVDKSVSNSELATKTIEADDVSLNDVSGQLKSQRWLTVLGTASLDREATRIAHAQNALAAARTIADDEGEDGRFWHSLYASLADLTTVNTQAGGGDLNAAKTTLITMKSDVDQAAQLSTSPGLPQELHNLLADMQAYVSDYAQQLDARLAGDDAGAAASQESLGADLQRMSSYDIDKIGSEINAFYKPLIDRFNTEIAAATS